MKEILEREKTREKISRENNLLRENLKRTKKLERKFKECFL